LTAHDKLRVALLGADEESGLLLGALVDDARVGDVYLAERDEKLVAPLTRRWGIIKRTVADWRELLREETVDVVWIAGPLSASPEAAGAALAAGKHVVLAGPPRSAVDLQLLVQAARKAPGRLRVALPHLYNPTVVKARQVVAAGDVGELQLGQALALMPAEAGKTGAKSGLAAAFTAIYVLQDFLGPATSVAASADPGEKLVGATLQHAAALSTLTAGGLDAEARPVQERRLVGTEGTLLLRDDPEDELPLIGLRGEEFIPIPVRVPLHVYPYAVAQAAHALVDSLLAEKDNEETLEAAFQALATARALDESVRSGRRVTVEE
jgi:predicted dehydrogenase